jgi:hypothetical protein
MAVMVLIVMFDSVVVRLLVLLRAKDTRSLMHMQESCHLVALDNRLAKDFPSL